MSGAGLDHLSFGCGSTLVELPLFPALVLATPVDSVIALELVIDFDVASTSLPEWWRMGPGECREDSWAADALAGASCIDPWESAGLASVQGWISGQPGGVARHGRLLVAVAPGVGQLASFEADVAYSLARIRLRTINTPSCPGCTIPACMVFNSVLIRRLPGSSVEEIFISDPEMPGLERATWQGGSGADCQSVPARRTTWGMVKGLYR